MDGEGVAVLAGELTKECVVRDECMWSDDMTTWEQRYFVVRKSQIGGFEIAHYKDATMAVLAGMILTLDVKEVKIREFPDHPYTLTFETRRGRVFGFSFKDRELLREVGSTLPLPIAGLMTGNTDSSDKSKMIGDMVKKSLLGETERPNLKATVATPVPPCGPRSNSIAGTSTAPCPMEKPARSSSATFKKQPPKPKKSDSVTKMLSMVNNEGLDGAVMVGCPEVPPKGRAVKPLEARSSTMPVMAEHMRLSRQGSISELMDSPTPRTSTLFTVDTITLELSERDTTLSTIGDSNPRFEAEVLPILEAIALGCGKYTTKATFVQLMDSFYQNGWSLAALSIVKPGVVRCCFATRWGDKILHRIKQLDNDGKKRELMECLHTLKLSLDLNLME